MKCLPSPSVQSLDLMCFSAKIFQNDTGFPSSLLRQWEDFLWGSWFFLNERCMHSYTTYPISRFCKTVPPTDPLCFLKQFCSKALVILINTFFFPISFFQEQLIPETSLTDCPIVCLNSQELLSVDSFWKAHSRKLIKFSSFFFFFFFFCLF